MSDIIRAVRAQYPAYADVPEDELTVAIAEKYPAYLDDPEFKAAYDSYSKGDTFGVGQEIRGVGRALKRGTLAADQGMASIAFDMDALNSQADVEEINRTQKAIQEYDAKAQSDPAFAASPRGQQWRQEQESRLGELTADLRRREPRIPENLRRIARREEQIQALPPSPDLAGLHDNFWRTLATNPVETIATVTAESLPQMIPGMVAGMATGNPAGVAAGAGLNSLAVEYAHSLLDTARADGVDLTDPKAAQAYFGDSANLAKARAKAIERGMPVAAFDAATAGLAGQFLKPALGQGARQVLTASGKDLALQMGGGMAGETAGQIVSEGRITSVPDIVLEGIAELGTAPGEVFGNLRNADVAPVETAGRRRQSEAWSDTPARFRSSDESTAELNAIALPEIEDELPAPPPIPFPEPVQASIPPEAQVPDTPVDYAPWEQFGGDPNAATSEREDASVEAPDAAQPAELVPSREWAATTPQDGREVRGQYEVVDAADLVTSFDANYDQSLQPRDRSRAASANQVASIVQRLEPDRLGAAPTTDLGAPVVDTANQVLSGNGRVTALRTLYGAGAPDQPGQIQADRGGEYRQWLVRNAEQFGINPPSFAAMRYPVLIRRVTDFGGLTPQEFARQSNQSQLLGQSEAEAAASDARLLVENQALLEQFLPDESGNVLAASNRPFLNAFIQGTGAQAELLSRDGYNGPALTRRVKNAVLGALLGPESRTLLGNLLERGDELGVREVTNGVMAATPQLIRLKGTSYDLGAILQRSLTDLARWKQSGETLSDFLGQGVLFGDPGRTAATDELLSFLANARSQKQATEGLTRYARAAREAIADQQSGEPATRDQLVQRIYGRGETKSGEQGVLREEPPSESARSAAESNAAAPPPDAGLQRAGADARASAEIALDSASAPVGIEWQREVRSFQGDQWEVTAATLDGHKFTLSLDGGRPRFTAWDGSWWVNFDEQGKVTAESQADRAVVPSRLRDALILEAKRMVRTPGPLGPSVYLRFGPLPKGGRSLNHVTGEREAGVSVYRANWNPAFGSYELADASHAGTAMDLIAQGKKPAFYDGEVVGSGSDGEPVLSGVRKLGGAAYATTRHGYIPTRPPGMALKRENSLSARLGKPEPDPVEAAIDKLKINPDALLEGSIVGIPITVWNGLLNAVKLAYRAGKSLAAAIDAGIQWLREQHHSFDERQVRAALEKQLLERQYADQLDASPDIGRQVKLGIENRFYVKKPNETSAAAAARIISAVGGPQQAIEVFSDRTNGLDGATRSMLGQLIVKQMAEEERTVRGHGDTATADALAARQIRFIDDLLLPHTTDLGQALQAFAAFQFMTPQGIVNYARRQIERASGKGGDRARPGTDAVVDALNAVNGQAIEATVQNPDTQKAARNVTDDDIAHQAATHGTAINEAITIEATNSLHQMAHARAKRQRDALASLQALSKDSYWSQIIASSSKSLEAQLRRAMGGAQANGQTVASLAADMVRGFGERLLATLPSAPRGTALKPTDFALMKSILANQEKAQEVWSHVQADLRTKYADEPTVIAALSRDYSAWGPGLMRGVLDEYLKGFDVGLAELIRNHYHLKQGALRDKLMTALGVDATTAARMAKDWDELFAGEVTKIWSTMKQRTAAVRKDERLLRAVRSGVVDLGDLPNSDLDRAIARRLTALRMNLGALVRQHYTTANQHGWTLAQRLVSEAGLRDSAAEEFANAIDRRFRAAMADRKKREIARLESAMPSAPAKLKQAWQRLVELSNLGALDSEKAWDSVREKLGLPKWTPELAAEVNRRADEIQRAPEGHPRERKIAELLQHLAAVKGVTWWDLGMSFWYANTLSGPLTHVANLLGNTQNLAANVAIAMRRPTTWIGQMEALGRGLKVGTSAGAEILKTGLVVGRTDKFRTGNALEVKRLAGRADYLLAPWRAVSRALAAGDAIFFHGAAAMRSSMLAQLVAKREGFEGRTMRRRALEIQGLTAKHRADAEAQVAREGLAGRQARLRVEELLDRQQPDELRESARQFALRVTYNQEPYGLLGVIAKAINFAGGHAPVIRLVVPFTNIIANITNESLNYLPPVGAGRAIWGHLRGELEDKPIASREDLHDQWAKAALGTFLLATIWATKEAGEGDDDWWFDISGSGPRTKAQREQLRLQGWRPNSLRFGDRWVSYASTPLAIPLAVIGNWFDARKYKRLDEQDGFNRVAYVMANLGDVILRQSFLDGATRLVGFLDRDNVNRGADFVRSVAGTASNAVIPNALRFVDRVFDPTVYDAKTIDGALTQVIPFVRREGRPALNVWGEPVKAQVSDRFTTERQLDPALSPLTKRGLWISVPSQSQTLLLGKPMTDDEFYEFIKARGQALKGMLSRPDLQAALARMPDPAAGNVLDRIEAAATAQAKGAVLRSR